MLPKASSSELRAFERFRIRILWVAIWSDILNKRFVEKLTTFSGDIHNEYDWTAYKGESDDSD